MTTEPTTTTPSPAPGQTPPQGDPTPGQTPPPAQGQTPPAQTPPVQKTPLDNLPEDVRDYIRSLRKEAKDLREASEARERERQAADDARKQEQGQYKELAEQRASRIKEIEPALERLAQLTELVSGQIEDQIKEWPDDIKFSYPGSDADVIARLAWIEKAKPHVANRAKQTQAAQPGNKPNPQPASTSSGASQDRTELYRRYNAQRGNIM